MEVDTIIENIIRNESLSLFIITSAGFVVMSMAMCLIAHKIENSIILDFSRFFLLLPALSIIFIFKEIGFNPVSFGFVLFAVLGYVSIFLFHREYPDPIHHEDAAVEIEH